MEMDPVSGGGVWRWRLRPMEELVKVLGEGGVGEDRQRQRRSHVGGRLAEHLEAWPSNRAVNAPFHGVHRREEKFWKEEEYVDGRG
jgi:hypothetical protein